MNRSIIILFALTLGLLAWACGAQGESTEDDTNTVEPLVDPEGDHIRSGARGLFDEDIADSIDVGTGDTTDIRYIDVDGPSLLSVRVTFQGAITGRVALVNQRGDILETRPISAADSIIRVRDVDVAPGRYFVRLEADDGASLYTISREITPQGPRVDPVVAQARRDILAEAQDLIDRDRYSRAIELLEQAYADDPDFEQQATQLIARAEEAREEYIEEHEDDDDDDDDDDDSDDDDDDDDDDSDGDGDNDGDSDDTDSTDTDGSDSTDTDGNGGDGDGDGDVGPVRASIIQIRQLSGSQSTLMLRGCGSSSGLSEGDHGEVDGIDVEITNIVSSDSCEAVADASPGQIGGASHVDF